MKTSKTFLLIFLGLLWSTCESKNLQALGNCLMAMDGFTCSRAKKTLAVSPSTDENHRRLLDSQMQKINRDGEVLIFKRDCSLPQQLPQQLNRESATIIAGVYDTSLTFDKSGQTALALKTQ